MDVEIGILRNDYWFFEADKTPIIVFDVANLGDGLLEAGTQISAVTNATMAHNQWIWLTDRLRSTK